ncbi:dihydroorotate oxidase [Facklamia miroungae]|uniref:dihydroorotate oxidase (fumarate) n=1 Tax=Facklamia miroungae TaxID=120956 RepID=A0A1G7U1X5_9LACT|nr:dihydroorotate oxidase [Facklamia miroungae]NKZ29868.1 dihydroorotate oxidase [Facklamia miroungae]SDG41374.1 dihydroorotate dehydrogenase (fumarate) [Facklamia miroungae]
MTLNTQIASRSFKSCLMNAAGVHCQTSDELDDILNSQAATFVTKTATSHARNGNPEPRYVGHLHGSINSMGLPNLGIDYYLEYLKEIDRSDVFLSVTGLSKEEIYQVLHKVQESSFDGLIELNLSCPNVVGKPQTAYDFDLMDEILAEVFNFVDKPLGVKLPPYFDLVHFDQVAGILNQFPLSFVNSVNSIGNGLWINDQSVAIKPKQGFGGIGGAAIKATALANVHAFYQRLNDSIAIIGTGGVATGRDAFEHILCGASMVQVGTALMTEGPQIFERLDQELSEIMTSYGYHNLKDFRGQLRYIEE